MKQMTFWRNLAINKELNEEWKVINREIWVCNGKYSK